MQEPDGPIFSALRRAIVEVKQHWSVIEWVTKNLLSQVLRASDGFNCILKPNLITFILLQIFKKTFL
jgi:hypothetical protein